MSEIYSIDLSKISPDVNQPRKKFNEEELRELSKSIIEYGLLQPIIVRVNKEELSIIDEKQSFTIIAGERRYRACILAKLEKINCFVRFDGNVREIALIENIQRKNLNKIEEATAIKELIESKNYTQEEVAFILSKSRPYITNSLRLLNLDNKTQKALLDEKISDAHARVLAGIQIEKERQKLLNKILQEKLSVREVEKYSKNIKKRDVILDDYISNVSEKMDTKVYVRGNADKGTLCIEYSNEKELDKILTAILENYN